MIQFKYRLRAYASRHQGESGRFSPMLVTSTGDFRTAKHEAVMLADHFGSCVIENTETGERTWITI